MSAPTLDDRVTLGVAWLDEHQPDWLDHIDVTTLDLSSAEGCVLGQVFATSGTTGYWYAIRRFFKDDFKDDNDTEDDTVRLGFDPRGVDLRTGVRLTTAWVARIEQLRAERGAK